MVYKMFHKKSKGSCIKDEIKQNQQLAKERYKSIIRKLKKEKCILLSKTIIAVLI